MGSWKKIKKRIQKEKRIRLVVSFVLVSKFDFSLCIWDFEDGVQKGKEKRVKKAKMSLVSNVPV